MDLARLAWKCRVRKAYIHSIMLGLSKKCFFACEAVLTIAYDTSNSAVSGKDLCVRLGLPPRYLESMMQTLVRAGILRGIRGPSGGYSLAKSRSAISLGDLCDALMDEDERFTSTTDLGAKILIPIHQNLHSHSIAFLSTISLEDICQKAASSGIALYNAPLMDFTI